MQVIVANANFALTSKNLEEKALRSSAVYPEDAIIWESIVS